MKKLITIVILALLTLNVKAQNLDSLTKKVNDMQLKVDNMSLKTNNIQLNLKKCHKVYEIGTALSISGIVLGGLGSFIYIDANNQLSDLVISNTPPRHAIDIDTQKRLKRNSNIGKCLIIFGSITSLSGTLVIIDSHKYIGLAGTQDGLTIKLNIDEF